MTVPSTGLPNIRVVIREADDANLTLDVPNLVVKVEKNSDYNVNVTPAVVKTLRTGSFNTIAQLALTAISASFVGQAATSISSSYATTASYAINAGQGSGFPFSGSAVITGSLLITSSTAGPSLTVYGSDIYVRGVRIGAGPNGAVASGDNVVFGNEALSSNTTGIYNTAIGHEALRSNTVGVDNTAIGYHALSSSYSGSSNVAVGAFSLNRNTVGLRNVAVGPATMYFNTSGSFNTAFGAFALRHNDTGSYNTVVGFQAFEDGHGDSNTVFGAQAAKFVTGSYNTYVGRFDSNQNGYDFRTGSNFIVLSDGQSNVRTYYDGIDDTWYWVTDATESLQLNTASLQSFVPVVATSFTGSFYGTASVAAGIDVISAGIFTTGSGSYIIPSPSGGLSYVTSASYALTASYALSATATVPAGTISSSVQVVSSLPVGTVSSSVQVSTGSFTGSFTGSLLGTSSVANTAISSSYAATASYFEGTMQGIQEEIILSSSVGATTSSFDFSNASIFYLTGMTGNGIWNITNVPTTAQKATTFTFVLEQGATPYSASGYQLNSSNVTVKWLGSSTPTGSANKTDIIGLTAFRSGSTWNVVGVLSSFG